jgi:hypothetical protein
MLIDSFSACIIIHTSEIFMNQATPKIQSFLLSLIILLGGFILGKKFGWQKID